MSHASLKLPITGLVLLFFMTACQRPVTVFYFSANGSDQGVGSLAAPWKSLDPIRGVPAADSLVLLFHGGDTIHGNLGLSNRRGIFIGTYGTGRAVLDAGDSAGITMTQCRHISVSDLVISGSGRKSGNRGPGILLQDCERARIHSVDATGFQKAGISIQSSAHVSISGVSAFNNGAAGIEVGGRFPSHDSKDIYIGYSRAENNPGDPTNLDNHSGNGIVVGLTSGALIEYCTASHNGWDMPRIGNGPVGIWAWESDHITIQHCLSYENMTHPGAMDGGGFDLDGGVTSSVIQYCLSYGNMGSGYGLFQFAGASPWFGNTIRYCISEDDGWGSSGAALYVWSNSTAQDDFHDAAVYNCVFYNRRGKALRADNGRHAAFRFYNNIMVSKDTLIQGSADGFEFRFNDWYSLSGGFRMPGSADLKSWASVSAQEVEAGRVIGWSADPGYVLKMPRPTDARMIGLDSSYRTPPGSWLKTATGNRTAPPVSFDFFGQRIADGPLRPGVDQQH
ncbi:MAG: right-handed parallel beta-helix repeat-containing protein [Cyclobacteriaceae bacterium]